MTRYAGVDAPVCVLFVLVGAILLVAYAVRGGDGYLAVGTFFLGWGLGRLACWATEATDRR